jgi:energy-converting hydrogenase Eha subunit C
MVRSYILTFSFVITRVLSPLWPIFHVSITQYGMIEVILNVLYLLVADIALNWREISTRRA